MPTIDDISLDDLDVIVKIAERAGNELKGAERLEVALSVSWTHTGWTLNLPDLLAAKPFDFAHDVYGMLAHLDPDTKELTGAFMPRFLELPASFKPQAH